MPGDDLSIENGPEGLHFADTDSVILEVKVSNSVPFWLARILSDFNFSKQGFSKYCTSIDLMEEEGFLPTQLVSEAIIMTNFWNDLQQLADMTGRVTILEAFAAIFLSFILTIIIATVYRKTHTGARYSQSFVQTIIIMGVVVSVIMIVIGNNIAVAFGLVGAFSIIRFRSAMSDPKDIAFIFFGMAAGITCGLGYYILAILFTMTLVANYLSSSIQ